VSFLEELSTVDTENIARRIESASDAEVDRALSRERASVDDILALLSPAAARRLEDLAERSASLTRRRFGCTMTLYAPLYVSNECVNACVYCGFSRRLQIPRMTLDVDTVVREADVLRSQGFRHVLLVSGENPRSVDARYVEAVVRAVRSRFHSISIETAPFESHEYARIAKEGVDGLALYQETYLAQVYREVHPVGPKSRFDRRIEAIERGGEAGFRSLGIGALLGLSPFRVEMALLALHGRYLSRRFWKSRIAVSFPRIRPTPGGFSPPHPLDDRDLVQSVCAMRLALPDADLVLSTREPPHLRDGLMSLGITRMSAGSRTNPGGYASEHSRSGRQFAIEDDRSPAEIARVLSQKGLEPLWKDFDRSIHAPNSP
jgi:2-iminoacetate synthase